MRRIAIAFAGIIAVLLSAPTTPARSSQARQLTFETPAGVQQTTEHIHRAGHTTPQPSPEDGGVIKGAAPLRFAAAEPASSVAAPRRERYPGEDDLTGLTPNQTILDRRADPPGTSKVPSANTVTRFDLFSAQSTSPSATTGPIYIIDPALPNGGDCSRYGSWDPNYGGWCRDFHGTLWPPETLYINATVALSGLFTNYGTVHKYHQLQSSGSAAQLVNDGLFYESGGGLIVGNDIINTGTFINHGWCDIGVDNHGYLENWGHLGIFGTLTNRPSALLSQFAGSILIAGAAANLGVMNLMTGTLDNMSWLLNSGHISLANGAVLNNLTSLFINYAIIDNDGAILNAVDNGCVGLINGNPPTSTPLSTCPPQPLAYFGYLDSDGDGIPNTGDGMQDYTPCTSSVAGCDDNCPMIPNLSQVDSDADGSGDACDCGSSHPDVHPGAVELCDGVDNQCPGDLGYGSIDEGCGVDNDGDGWIPAEGDCDDTKQSRFPDAPELCDGFDNQCPGDQGFGKVDERCNDDGDGYCDSAMTTVGAPPICPNGGGDCNDMNDEVFPTATEICDGIDNQCPGEAGYGQSDDQNDPNWDPWHDTDGDGLYDCWEQYGIDSDSTTPGVSAEQTVDLALNKPPFNANRRTKDLFVEIDYMANSLSGCPVYDGGFFWPHPAHVPDSDALSLVVERFKAKDITLHLDSTPMEAVPHDCNIDLGFDNFLSTKAGPGFNYTSGLSIEESVCQNPGNAYLGTQTERTANCRSAIRARSWAFRYALFAHRIDGYSGAAISCSVLYPGPNPPEFCAKPDFMISMGYLDRHAQNAYDKWKSFNTTPSKELTDYVGGTFMHELGHTLGLFHGGEDPINCKPNYLSVMNYTRQFNKTGSVPGAPPGAGQVRTNRRIDYSDVENSLHETYLSEPLGAMTTRQERIIYGCHPPNCSTPTVMIENAWTPIDWNGDGDEVDARVDADISRISDVDECNCTTYDPNTGCFNNPTPNSLVSYNDWDTILGFFRLPLAPTDPNAPSASAEYSPLNITSTELTIADYLNAVLGGSDVDADGVENLDDLCRLQADPNQENLDADFLGDACDCLPADGNYWDAPWEVPTLSFLDTTRLEWSAPTHTGSYASGYDTLRTGNASDFSVTAVCVEANDGTDTTASDMSSPGVGGVYYYLVRAVNSCPWPIGLGPLGARSDGTLRTGRTCP